jgi:CBS domain-containing protein
VAIVVDKSIFGDLSVKEAMRRQVISLPATAPISQAIRYLTKYKVNALLATDDLGIPAGVVSKTDVMGAYYASLPVDSPLHHIMMSPPLYCSQSDSIESALMAMQSHRIYRLYVAGKDPGQVVGVLAYPDIVGLLYRLCHDCDRSLVSRQRKRNAEDADVFCRVRDVMTTSVVHFSEDDSLSQIMEGLSNCRFGAVLIKDVEGRPSGVISKTDLILAYKRGIEPDVEAKIVLSSRSVISCDEEELLANAIRTMVFGEIHRIFVHRSDPHNVVGVFSLSDVARLRSGSCHACMSTRIQVDRHA